MKTVLRNKSKMKEYLSRRSNRKITEEEFQECIDYFIEAVDYIEETREGNNAIRESADLTVDIDDEEIEVWVIYDFIIENGEKIAVIDFDYNYENPLEDY